MAQLSTNHVFMSYSRRDDVVMRRIVAFLRAQGIKVWVDNEKLVPGTPIWEEEIERAIKSAPAIVAVLSPDSKGSEWVRREINLADQYKKRVFPVMVRGDEESSISLRLIGRQYVDIRNDEEAGLKYVSASLLRYLEELDTQEQSARKEAARLTAQKTRNEKKLAKQKADEGRNAGQVSNLTDENEKRLAAQKVEDEGLAREKAETERKAKEEADRLAAQKAEDERFAREKAERLDEQKVEEDRISAEKADIVQRARVKEKKLGQVREAQEAAEREPVVKNDAQQLSSRIAAAKSAVSENENQSKLGLSKSSMPPIAIIGIILVLLILGYVAFAILLPSISGGPTPPPIFQLPVPTARP